MFYAHQYEDGTYSGVTKSVERLTEWDKLRAVKPVARIAIKMKRGPGFYNWRVAEDGSLHYHEVGGGGRPMEEPRKPRRTRKRNDTPEPERKRQKANHQFDDLLPRPKLVQQELPLPEPKLDPKVITTLLPASTRACVHGMPHPYKCAHCEAGNTTPTYLRAL